MRIAFFQGDSNGGFPVPASKGGAVSTLVEHILEGCNDHDDFEVSMFSYYDVEAEKLSLNYANIKFRWVKVPQFIRLLDSFIFFLCSKFFKKSKAISFKSIFSLFFFIFKSVKVLRKESFDKVIFENFVMQSWIVKLSHYSGWYSFHFHNVPRSSVKCQTIFDKCNKFFCVSKFVADQISHSDSSIGLIPQNKISVYYNCIDTNLFTRIDNLSLINQTKSKYNISLNEKVIVFTGRLSVEKGIDKLLKAIPLVAYKKLKILIVGSLTYGDDKTVDDYQLSLRELASQLDDKIIFTGFINQKDLPLVYSISDIAVLPSVWDEPAGLTMLEAMSCGIPVITTNSGGIPEYVSDCAICLDRDSDLIANIALSIDNLLFDDEYRNRLSRLGSQRVRTFFNLDKYYENFVKVIKE